MKTTRVLTLVGAIFSVGCPLLFAAEPASVVEARPREATAAVVNPAVRSALRQTISLDGAWDFAIDPKKVGRQQEWFSPDKQLPNKLSIKVPGCWEAQGIGGRGKSTSVTPERVSRPLRGSYVGAAWYRKGVAIPKRWAGRQVWLKFGGVHAQGWFWVNGTYLGHNACYCGTYKYNITDLVKPGQKAVVAVMVRNDVPSGKGLFGWVQRFGGLYRSVEIDATPDVLIDYAYVDGLLDEKKARAHVKLRSVQAAKAPSACEVVLTASTLDGQQAGQATAKVELSAPGTNDVTVEVALNPFKPWSPEHPHLYKAEIVLKVGGKAVDDWGERFGVRKWEVRGGSFYLNNQKYFVRGFGDDWVYPRTICSPPSRQEHVKHLRRAKDYGFAYVRHHTHCEIPEFYEGADEVGIMVQPELPYYGRRLSAGRGGVFQPKKDLVELITHYRRHVSLSTYCTGNEGHMGSPLDKEIYQLAKRLDPGRLVLHQDGGRNTGGNSDFDTGPARPWRPGAVRTTRPFFAHEYLNLTVGQDPRLAPKYTHAQLPPVPMDAFKKELVQAGLSLQWGFDCVDAGHQLQRIYQKRGLEAARLDPACDGYIYWTIVDVCYNADQGLLDQFWEPKASAPEFFRQFNSPTAVLVKLSPREQILTEGDKLKIEWWLSHFDRRLIKAGALTWALLVSGKVTKKGGLDGVNAEAGDVKRIGTTSFQVPSLVKPVRARLLVELCGPRAANSWDLWLFPKLKPKPGGGKGLCASRRVYAVLANRYPGLAVLGTPAAADAEVILTELMDGQVLEALQRRKSVILLKLSGPRPGVRPGWWSKSAQAGTAIADHPAFGDFPCAGYLNELFFRIVNTTVRMNGGGFKSVEPLMVGHGREGYLTHVFQARAGRGKILASGLDLLADHPESIWLLDQFIRYVRSERFKPTGAIDLALAKARWQKAAALMKRLNGFSQTLKTFHRVPYESFLGRLDMCVARQTGHEKYVAWRTKPVPKGLDPAGRYSFKWIAGLGWITQPKGKFTLMLGAEALVDFHVTQKTATWKSSDAKVQLTYTVMAAPGLDSSGVMELTVPAALLKPGEKAELRVVPAQTGSRRWFAVYEYP